MNKFLLPVMFFLFFSACQKEFSRECNGGADCAGQKINVCHNGNVISINLNAWPAHRDHGDTRLDDEDGDGYVPDNDCGFGSMGDCDDNNADFHRGAAEICANNIDDNCNGEIDETCLASVVVCNQVWTVKNLDVTTYRNGDLIPQVTDPIVWNSLTTGAWCYYNNDPANGAVYGKLYNWYAVNDSRGLAPEGWHIATDEEWTILSDCLGGESVAGGKMKEMGTTHWAAPNTGATNSIGFTALPGGFRVANFDFMGQGGEWWSSTEDTGTIPPGISAWYRNIDFSGAYIGRSNSIKTAGYSVRCIED
jgi:uncharacterized protein (TIGR02145 family)